MDHSSYWSKRKQQRCYKTAEFVIFPLKAVILGILVRAAGACREFVYHQLQPNNLVIWAAFFLVAACFLQRGCVTVFISGREDLRFAACLVISLCPLYCQVCLAHAAAFWTSVCVFLFICSVSAHHKHKIRLRCQTPSTCAVHHWFPVIPHPRHAIPSPITVRQHSLSLFICIIRICHPTDLQILNARSRNKKHTLAHHDNYLFLNLKSLQ